MKPRKIVFVDETLEKSFNNIGNKDPLKKSLIKAMQTLKKDAFIGRNVKKETYSKRIN